ncbi:hypothetical protein C8Q79DRAFT_969142 [Trametes meyenii]|nr:hypothetical protein C8Q79DRAFT_969142 [Trametes meyenii]
MTYHSTDVHCLFKQAADDHPILKRFQNSWLTAELAKQYLQNKRRHAVKRGYIDRAQIKTARRGARRHARA